MLNLIRRMRGPRRLWAVPLMIGAALALFAGAGCGDDDAEQGAEATTTAPATTAPAETAPAETAPSERPPAESAPAVRVEMSEFRFAPASLTVRRGEVLDVADVGSVPHNLTIEQGSAPETDATDLAATSTFEPGQSEELRVDLAPGTYVLVCTVPGHREAGMVGTITVRG